MSGELILPTNLPFSSTTAHEPQRVKAICLKASIALSLVVIDTGRDPTG
jgi:hypothetical protein